MINLPFSVLLANFEIAKITVLQSFRSRTKVIEFFFRQVAGYNLTKKGLHQGAMI